MGDMMKYVRKLEVQVDRELKQIQLRKQEREDKLCGVCFNREAICKLNCPHKLCNRCYPMLVTCPFCRKPYTCVRYLEIASDSIIHDINATTYVGLQSNMLFLEVLESISRRMNQVMNKPMILRCCDDMNSLLGGHIFYRNATTDNKIKYKLNFSTLRAISFNLHKRLNGLDTFYKNQIIHSILTIIRELGNVLKLYNDP